ncbi:Uu.00g147160.m01.CDS01 [Anthostomella pinea]|uniref:Uu.00g147160.m01.CDS01 n=1 Tax=Anthostomella pinea TaxID=933095 RepID=A0AAI8VRE7_9PEZI|nr:Uu.00g147160.m01.CDS01 [Anthostomella pinea]
MRTDPVYIVILSTYLWAFFCLAPTLFLLPVIPTPAFGTFSIVSIIKLQPLYQQHSTALVTDTSSGTNDSSEPRRRPGCSTPLKLDSRYEQSTTAELPYPATKLLIGQHLCVHPSRRSWAWLVVGAFYDDKDNELWHIEVFLSNIAESGRVPGTDATDLDAGGNEIVYEELDYNFQIDIDSHPTLYQTGPPEPLPFDVEAFFGPVPATHSPLTNFPFPATMSGQGWNSQSGWDGRRGAAGAGAFYGNAFPTGGYAAAYPGAGFMPGQGAYPYAMGQQSYPIPAAPNGLSPAYVVPSNGYAPPVPFWQNTPARLPQPHPVVDYTTAGFNMVNSTGGAGCEPGYGYVFHGEHTKVHIIKSSRAPWRSSGMSFHFIAAHIPVNTTIGELMVGFGACDSVPKKNKLCEVLRGGNGQWYRGMIFAGDEREDLKKTLKQVGWDGSRNGQWGQKPVVWLWVTKD